MDPKLLIVAVLEEEELVVLTINNKDIKIIIVIKALKGGSL